MKKLLLYPAAVISFFFIFNQSAFGQVDLYLDKINIYVSDYGRVAIYSLPDTTRQLYRNALLVGTGENSVFDLINDLDIEEPTQMLASPTYGDYEIYGSYNNNYSSAPPNVLEKVNVYCWQNLTSFIVKYTVTNRETNSIDAIIGFEHLPRIDNNRSGGDTVTYSKASGIISTKNGKVVGFKPLSENLKSLSAFYYFTDYEKDSLFYSKLSYNSFDSSFVTNPNDADVDAPALIPSFNSRSIATGDSVTYYIALSYGTNEAEMLAGMEQAQQKYNLITSVEPDLNKLPTDFTLEQNYPNPFNPETTIRYKLQVPGYTALKVYDVLGNEVASLVNEYKQAGTYSIQLSTSSLQLSSGVYFYQLKSGSYTAAKKMIVLK